MDDVDDDILMNDLGTAVRAAGQVPESFVVAARAAFAWRHIDDELELLTLSYDSSVSATTTVRGPAAPSERILVFESEEATMTLEVGAQVLMGQLVPARTERVALEDPQGTLEETETDDSGFFLFRRPVAGPVRLRWYRSDAGAVTQWVPI